MENRMPKFTVGHTSTDSSRRADGRSGRRSFLKKLCVAGLAANSLHGLARGSQAGSHEKETAVSDLRQFLLQAELADTHEHTLPEAERVRATVDLFTLISHYTINDLISAGLESRMRTELLKPEVPVSVRWKSVAPYWERARNTGYARALEIALRDIYGAEELNEQTCEAISERIRAANQKGIHERVLREKSRIRLAVLDDSYNTDPVKPDLPLFVTSRRFDRFVAVSSRESLRKLEDATGRSISTLADLERALENDFARNLKAGSMAAIKIALAYSRPLFFRETLRADAERDFEQVATDTLPPVSSNRLEQLKEVRARRLQDYMLHRLVQLACDARITVQIHTGLQSGNGNFIPNSNPTHLVNLFFDYPEVRFDVFHAGYPYLSEMATLAKNFPNVYIDLCWMHIISPAACRRALHEYLDAVPASKILGFGGDYRYVELTYGHSVIARENMIRVLEEKVAEGYFTNRQALGVGKRLFYDNAAELFPPARVA